MTFKKSKKRCHSDRESSDDEKQKTKKQKDSDKQR